MSTLNTDTIVALATANGIGAIAVLRLSGEKAISICNEVFFGADLSKVASHSIHFGSIRDENTIIDEVLVSIFRAPTSYTKEDVIEISCHGSSYIVQRILQLLIKKGARSAKPGEFTLRAFLNGQLDLSQAEAVADLIASSSEASHQIAMKQMRGGFSNELKKLREELIHFASLVELELDFSEEDVEFANREHMKDLVLKIHKVLQHLIQSFHLGNVIKKGVPVVIVGKPNVGKSTLLNALLKEERAIVSDIAGTTRDTIEETINISGVLFRFIDTAGIRETTDLIEAKGVEKTFEKIDDSAIVLYMFENDEKDTIELKKNIEELESICKKNNSTLLLVANKVDAENADKIKIAPYDVLHISALKNLGIDELQNTLLNIIQYNELSKQDTIASNIRHLEALQNADNALLRVIEGIENPITSDFLAIDIKQALHFLGEITGSISTDDLLENIFSKFCIGK